MKRTELETEKISKLVKKFSVPCVISMVVAALYNIVDQIFIGWSEAGAFGNAATNIVYPFTVLALGLALLIGDGAASNFSISLGKKEKEEANTFIGNGMIMLLLLAVLLTAAGLLFSGKILGLFGANPEEEICYQYAKDYFRIICMGVPFYMIGQGMNASIRADGSPKYAMAGTLTGAVTNLIMDPLLIFGFHMGVKGAAIATVMGQAVTFSLSIYYFFHSKTFQLSAKAIQLKKHIISKIIAIGMASLIVQLSIVLIVAVNNHLFTKYGYMTIASTGEPFGAIVPLAVVGIVMKVFGIVMSVTIGISVGGQPIIGYNLGAGNMERVKETIHLIHKLVLCVGLAAFLLFEFAPDLFIMIFGNNNTPEYKEFARFCFRIFLGGIILTCYIKSSAVILQAIGSSKKATFLALLRDVIIFIPATILLGSVTHNIIFMLWAPVIADVVTSMVAWSFLRRV